MSDRDNEPNTTQPFFSPRPVLKTPIPHWVRKSRYDDQALIP
ncbi:hypothetical protein HNQ09_003443 [Deinococcus budaensis]|uniref:Uncharacterized protein n=1 Tax=Deinococcus budaensis TaxID=1665626 RepID=A0A7W8GIJ0_9DEIO|nr:hypothetical protein [Deinococcus budaensis]